MSSLDVYDNLPDTFEELNGEKPKRRKKKKKKAIPDWHFPSQAVAYLLDGTITSSEFVVLGAINVLTHTYGKYLTVGCFATNNAIGRSCGMSGENARRLVYSLLKKGIIAKYEKRTSKRTTRYLYPIWRSTRDMGYKKDTFVNPQE